MFFYFPHVLCGTLDTFYNESRVDFIHASCHGTRPNEHNRAVDDMHKSRSVDQSVFLPLFRTQSERA